MKKKILIMIYVLGIVLSGTSAVFADTHGFHIDKNFNVIPNDKRANKKVVLLTIDDGPSKESTAFIDILQKHNAKAIFFVNGIHDAANQGAIEKDYRAGHTIGNHTWSHPNLRKIPWAKAQKEIDDDTALIKKITGENPRFFRPPYGVSTPQVRIYVEKNNMRFMNWSGSVRDWEKTAHKEGVYVANAMKDIHNGEIILLHEHDWSASYFDALLSQLEKRGYSFINPHDIE